MFEALGRASLEAYRAPQLAEIWSWLLPNNYIVWSNLGQNHYCTLKIIKMQKASKSKHIKNPLASFCSILQHVWAKVFALQRTDRGTKGHTMSLKHFGAITLLTLVWCLCLSGNALHNAGIWCNLHRAIDCWEWLRGLSIHGFRHVPTVGRSGTSRYKAWKLYVRTGRQGQSFIQPFPWLRHIVTF